MRRTFLILVSMLFLTCARAQSQTVAQSEITVSATASISADPDIAEFRISIIERQEQATTAFKMYLRAYGALQKSLKSVVDSTKLRTDNLMITPYFNFKKPDQMTPEYYQVNAAMSLSVPISDLNKTLAAVTAVDGVTMNGIEFSTKDQEELETKALEQAVREARAKAEAIARLEGLTDLRVKSMNTSTSRPPIMPMYRTMSADAIGPSVNPTSISVSATVNVTYTATSK